MKLPVLIYKERGCDYFGCGHFGANRGKRKHKGLDLAIAPNKRIFSPIKGTITKEGYPYADDLSYRYVRIENKDYKVQLFYTKLRHIFNVGDEVCEGDWIAVSQNIAKRYTSRKKVMVNHCHFEVYKKEDNNWVLINPENIL